MRSGMTELYNDIRFADDEVTRMCALCANNTDSIYAHHSHPKLPLFVRPSLLLKVAEVMAIDGFVHGTNDKTEAEAIPSIFQ